MIVILWKRAVPKDAEAPRRMQRKKHRRRIQGHLGVAERSCGIHRDTRRRRGFRGREEGGAARHPLRAA